MITIDKDVVVIRHKKTATKKVYVNGHLMRVYHRCPHPDRLLFRSNMVNDVNQDLCGGWSRFKDGHRLTVERVMSGLKPFGNIAHFTHHTGHDLEGMRARLEKQGCITKAYRRELSGGHTVENLDFTIPGTLGEHFDLEALAADYQRFMPHYEDGKKVLTCRAVPMSLFLGGRWDNLDWLTGLILGYPVENTMSILGGIE